MMFTVPPYPPRSDIDPKEGRTGHLRQAVLGWLNDQCDRISSETDMRSLAAELRQAAATIDNEMQAIESL